ncbi:hypothetical protein F5Y04DRAFT_78094 [Hypomontagnella monticulosa]|nr:hypothetical protein F5Y04DRAFT_78094 [Hypomontagnella monticulosa]
MKSATATSILLALISGLAGAIPPFFRDRDTSTDTLGWNSSSPLSPRQPISPPSHVHIPILLPEGHVGRRPRAHPEVNEDHRPDLPTSAPERGEKPHHHPHTRKGSEEEDSEEGEEEDDDIAPDACAAYPAPSDSTATEPAAAMAGLAVALGAAVALLI